MLKRMISVLVRKKSCNSMFTHASKFVFGRVLFGILFILLCSPEAHGQFIVQPMKFDVQGRAGSVVRTSFKLENRAKFESQFVTIRVVDLIQARDGSWEVFDANMLTESGAGYDSELHKSCKDWVSIRRTDVEVPNFDFTVENLEIRIPNRARGFFSAGLQVSLNPRPGLGGVPIRFDFVVPICVIIEGRALTSKVELLSSGMKFVEGKDDQKESASVVITLKNVGTSYSMLTPYSSIWQVLPTGRRLVKRDLKFRPIDIIPGAEIDMTADLERSLGSGKYRIVTQLSVDGRRVKPLSEVVDFVNPAFTGAAHLDAAMRLTPSQVDLEMLPGQMGSRKITIQNNSDEAIVVKAIPVVPAVMAGRVTDLRGEDLSCADWIEIRPNEVPIRAGGERNVTVLVRMPEKDDMPVLSVDPTNYYGTVKFYGFFRDRSSAGMSSAMVNVISKGAEVTPLILQKSVKVTQIAGTTRFQLVGVFSNIGLTHVVPTCTGRIQSNGALGSRTQYGVLKMVNEDADKFLMPYETRQFSGEFDFANIPEGKYLVTVRLDYGIDLSKQIQKIYEVFDQDGEKLVFSSTETSGSVASSGG